MESIFNKRQIEIAKQTLKMPIEIGQTKEEAREILRKFGYNEADIRKIEV